MTSQNLKSEWPINLLKDIFENRRNKEKYQLNSKRIDFIIKHQSVTIDKALEKYLTPREKDVLLKRYREGCTFKEIGEYYDISDTRSNQIISKALRKLIFSPSACKIIFYSSVVLEHRELELHERGFDEIEEDTIPSIYDMHIVQLNLSTRLDNILIRANLDTVSKILKLGHKSVRELKGMGEASYIELLDKFIELDILREFYKDNTPISQYKDKITNNLYQELKKAKCCTLADIIKLGEDGIKRLPFIMYSVAIHDLRSIFRSRKELIFFHH